jgi:hypothetical protein
MKKSTSVVIVDPFASLRVNCAKDPHLLVFKDNADASLRSVESCIVPAKAGIQFVLVTWIPALRQAQGRLYVGVTA